MDFFNDKHVEAAKDLLYKMADDQLIIGHCRHSGIYPKRETISLLPSGRITNW